MERETENLVFTSHCWGLSHGVIQTVDLAGPVLIGQVFKKDRYYNVRERETVNSYEELEIKTCIVVFTRQTIAPRLKKEDNI